MKKVILIGCGPIGWHFATTGVSSIVKQQIEVNIQENKKQLEEIRNVVFEPEPLEFINTQLECTEPKFYNDIPRNKFIDKPLHNFRKR